jgi:ATP-binding cassette subfamily B protein
LRQPAILILDEPTASLDAETAGDISRTLESLSKERTVISVTHLLSSVVNADQIFVIDAGQVAERGTHSELLAQQGQYHQLWHKQQYNGQYYRSYDYFKLNKITRIPIFHP